MLPDTSTEHSSFINIIIIADYRYYYRQEVQCESTQDAVIHRRKRKKTIKKRHYLIQTKKL